VTEAVKPVSDVIQRNEKYFSLFAVFREVRGYFTLCVSHSTTKAATNAKDTIELRGTALPFKANSHGFCGFQDF
jgi:hypothetical protein